MVEHFDALEADLLRHYQVDLPEALWGKQKMSARRLANLVRWLPPDSATARAADPTWCWDLNAQLLSHILEAVDVTNGMFYKTHVEEGAPPWEPVKIDRPWGPPANQAAKQSSIDEVADFFGLSVRYVPAGAEP